MARSLAERLRAHEQQKARLAEQEAKLKDAGRKARTRRLIEAGGLVDKVGLLDLDSNALYGALLSLRDGAGDKEQIVKWGALGGRAFAREARLRDEGKEAVVLTFPAPRAFSIDTYRQNCRPSPKPCSGHTSSDLPFSGSPHHCGYGTGGGNTLRVPTAS